MTTLPSKELLSEAWGSEVTSIEDVCTMWDMQVLPFWVKEKSRVGGYSDKKYHIAIETIAQKCKEWALSKRYEICSSPHTKNIQGFKRIGCAWIISEDNKYIQDFRGKKHETEAIIQACEWLREYLNEIKA